MQSLTKKIFQSKLLLSAIAILYAYFLWLMISQSFMDSIHLKAPIIFYDVPSESHIKTQESVDILVSGRRFDLRQLLKQNVSININGKQLSKGNNTHAISEDQILLPEAIKLINYNPAQLKIVVV